MIRSISRPAARRALAVVATAVALAAPAVTAAPAGAEEPGAAAAPAVSLWAPRQLTVDAWGKRAWTDLGLRLIADGTPLEIRATRASYADPVQAVWRTDSGDVPLPEGAMSDFSGLSRFLRITITPADGAEPTRLLRKACLNGWSERVRPDAPATSPYPIGCWYNPYTLGSVQGVEDGWATPLLAQNRPLRIAPGRYAVTARITPTYARLFGLTAAEATRSLQLTVRRADGVVAERPSTAGSHVARPEAQAPTGPEGAPAGPMPDLRSLPAWGIGISRNGDHLQFAATVWNAGNSPLVVDGFRRDDQDLMDAYQYFFDGAGNQTGYQEVGHLHWDARPSHQHWHFEDFARYELLRQDKTVAARSKKEAFCLANTDAVDLTVPDAAWRPENTELTTACGDYSSLSIREVLAAGWGDTYMQSRAGQSFNLEELPNGVYYIRVTANPDHNLVEQSTDNNVALRRVRIGGTPGHRTVRPAQVGIVEEGGYGGQG